MKASAPDPSPVPSTNGFGGVCGGGSCSVFFGLRRDCASQVPLGEVAGGV